MNCQDEDGPAMALACDHDEALRALVAPPNWRNPSPASCYNLVVIGGGTAGLVAAAGAAGLGASVALIEHRRMGGDCLNYGCVPSKALIRCARAAFDARQASSFGTTVGGAINTNFEAIMSRMRALRARLAVHDSVDRFAGLGIDVYLGAARFLDERSIEVDGQALRFKRAVIAAGARPTVPPIDGLAASGFLTNETIFSLRELPRQLAVLGGGPQGCEMAQVFRRLGSAVTLIHRSARLLNRDEEEASTIVTESLRRDGVRVLSGARLKRVDRRDNGERRLLLVSTDHSDHVDADAVLVSVGRTPNVNGIGLDLAGVAYDEKGIHVDGYLRTTNAAIYAAGDVCLDEKYTHAADASARLVVQNALFPIRRKFDPLLIPRCTYTDPELACVGMTEESAREAGMDFTVFRVGLENVDRALLDGETDGYAKILVRAGTDSILGATVVARHAGEMISEVTLAMARKLGLGALGTVVHPYPTQSEAVRKCADAYVRTRLTPRLHRWLERYMRWRR